MEETVGAPVQFFQSVIAIELAITGALLWQIRFFDRGDSAQGRNERLPDPRLSLLLAAVIAATVFGSLWSIVHHGGTGAEVFVTVGLALSLLPILIRVLPPLARDAITNERDPNYAVSIVGLVVYAVAVGAFVVLLSV